MNEHDIRSEILTALNFQYTTNHFRSTHSFGELVQICKQAIKDWIFYAKYDTNPFDAAKYGIDTSNPDNSSPLEQQQQQFMKHLVSACQKTITEPQYHSLNILNDLILKNKIKQLQLKPYYRDVGINFKFINIKHAMIYIALSQCKIWYIVCRNRRKNEKQFQLDSLVHLFEGVVKKLNIQNPFHVSILTRRAVRHIQKKQNIKKSNNSLFEAVSNSDYDLVKELIHKGADIQQPGFYTRRHQVEMKCTHRACMNNDLKMCKILDSFQANWEAEDSQKMTPIFYAVQAGIEIIKYLVEQIKVDIQKPQIQNRTPFYFACTQNDLNVISYLEKIGCDINKKSELGRTALSKACYLGRVDIVKFLLSCQQIDMYSKCKKGRTALHNAVFGPKGGRQGQKFGTNQKDSPQCAQILLENGFKVDYLDLENCTPLHIAMSSEAIDSIRLLIAFGASLSAKNNYGQTPLMNGAKFGHQKAVRILYQDYHSSILQKDIFNKNVMLLTAKFKQNGQDGTNPVFYYLLEKFIVKCIQEKNIEQIHWTFRELLINQSPIQLQAFWRMSQKYEVPHPIMQSEEIKKLLNLSIHRRTIIESNLKYLHKDKRKLAWKDQMANESNVAIQILKSIKIDGQNLQDICLWLILNNDSKLLDFVIETQILNLSNAQFSSERIFDLIQNQNLKQKVTTFCVLSLNFNWPKYRHIDGSNILHLLVRKQKSSTMIQLFKFLAGKIPDKIITNKYINTFTPEDRNKVLQQLLQSKDESDFHPHQLSLILKNKSIAKIIEEKLKQLNFQSDQILDIKEYEPIIEIDALELSKFNDKFHEREEQLVNFENQIEQMSSIQILQKWKFTELHKYLDKFGKQNKYFWDEIDKRQLIYLQAQQHLLKLKHLNTQKVIGIDLEYFNQEGITIISTLQLSSPGTDFIIDCLAIELKTIREYLQQIFHSKAILKIMHGADNDLILIRSHFNISLINFLDTSRIDVDLRGSKNDLRGLSTLSKQYLGITLCKQYQVSEWRIRPIPKAMLQYAKKDSLLLPYLLSMMLQKVEDSQMIKRLLLNGCKQVRRNKKQSQPLLAGLKTK